MIHSCTILVHLSFIMLLCRKLSNSSWRNGTASINDKLRSRSNFIWRARLQVWIGSPPNLGDIWTLSGVRCRSISDSTSTSVLRRGVLWYSSTRVLKYNCTTGKYASYSSTSIFWTRDSLSMAPCHPHQVQSMLVWAYFTVTPRRWF